MAKSEAAAFVVIDSFATDDGFSYHRGQVIPAGDPILKKHPSLFKAYEFAPAGSVGEVETATAAPGEKRAVSHPAPRSEPAAKAPEPEPAKPEPTKPQGLTTNQGLTTKSIGEK